MKGEIVQVGHLRMSRATGCFKSSTTPLFPMANLILFTEPPAKVFFFFFASNLH